MLIYCHSITYKIFFHLKICFHQKLYINLKTKLSYNLKNKSMYCLQKKLINSHTLIIDHEYMFIHYRKNKPSGT
jgi:hypothetical protein